MKRRWIRAIVAGATGLSVLATVGPAPAFAVGPAPGGGAAGGGTAVASPVASVLGEVPDTPGNRSEITVNNFAALWRSAGLGADPTLGEVIKPPGSEASYEILGGGALGAMQFQYLSVDPAPIGYRILGLDREVAIGTPPKQLSEVWGPIAPGPVSGALRKLKAVQTTSGGAKLFDLRAADKQSSPANVPLFEVGWLALPRGGGRLVGAYKGLPSSALTDLVEQKPHPDSLASDPAVAQLLAVLPANATTLNLGTSWIAKPLGKGATPQEIQRLQARSGLGGVHAPTYAGFAFSGPAKAVTLTAAAVYPNAADAKTAATAVGHYLRTGDNILNNQPFTKLWRVTGASAHGDVAVVTLAPKKLAFAAQTISDEGFPLFWKL